MALLRTALNRVEHTCPNAFSSSSSQAVGHRDSGWPGRMIYTKSKIHISNVLPVDRMNHFYCMYAPLSFKYMQMQKNQPLDNATEFNAFFCIYEFSQRQKKKIQLLRCRGQNSLKICLFLSIIKKNVCKNWE